MLPFHVPLHWPVSLGPDRRNVLFTDRQTDTHTHIQHLRAHSYLALTVSWSFFLPPNWFQNRVQRRTTLEKQVNSMKYTRIWTSEKFAETWLIIACGPNFPLRLPFLATVTQAILIIAVMYTTQLAVANKSLKKVPHERPAYDSGTVLYQLSCVSSQLATGHPAGGPRAGPWRCEFEIDGELVRDASKYTERYVKDHIFELRRKIEHVERQDWLSQLCST